MKSIFHQNIDFKGRCFGLMFMSKLYFRRRKNVELYFMNLGKFMFENRSRHATWMSLRFVCSIFTMLMTIIRRCFIIGKTNNQIYN